jgi:hypothetical protein
LPWIAGRSDQMPLTVDGRITAMVGIILIASASAAMAQLLRRMERRFERRRPVGSPITMASRLRDAS